MKSKAWVKKGWIGLLTALFCLQLLPADEWQADAATYKGSDYTSNKVIASRLDQVFATYGPGTYFTYDGGPCTDHGADNNGCSANLGADKYDCNCRRVLDDGTDLLASQCFGFARYVFYTCFGFIDNASVSPGKYVSLGSIQAGKLTADNVKALLTRAKAGAHVRVEGHSMAVLSTDANGITIIHANVNNQCDVVLQTLTWERFATLYNWRGIEYVNMPVDYPGSDEQVLPDVSTKNVQEGVYIFENVSTGRMLQVKGGKDADETPLITGTYKENDLSQQFNLRYTDSGRYYLGAMCSSEGENRVVDVIRGAGGQFYNGDKLEIYRAVDEGAQLFYLIPLEDGSWALELAAAPEKVITDQAKAGSQLTMEAYTGSALQKWQLLSPDGAAVGSGQTGAYTVTVDEGSVLNIRSEANTSSAIKGTIPNKTVVPVTRISNGWGYASHGGIVGWISLDYAQFTRAFGDANGDGAVQAGDALTVLQGATENAELSSLQQMVLDVDRDGEVTASDALLVLQYATRKITAWSM